MGTAEEKLAGVDQALSELGKSDEEITEVRNRYSVEKPGDLQTVDAELDALGENVAVVRPPPPPAAVDRQVVETQPPDSSDEEYWEGEDTNIDIIEETDFVLLVDEDDLEELEAVGEEDSQKTVPPSVPPQGEEDEGFFKKLFSGRSSNRPQ